MQCWFNDLKKVLTEFNIKLENIYNVDKSGFAIREKEAGVVIINANINQKVSSKAWTSRMDDSNRVYLCR